MMTIFLSEGRTRERKERVWGRRGEHWGELRLIWRRGGWRTGDPHHQDVDVYDDDDAGGEEGQVAISLFFVVVAVLSVFAVYRYSGNGERRRARHSCWMTGEAASLPIWGLCSSVRNARHPINLFSTTCCLFCCCSLDFPSSDFWFSKMCLIGSWWRWRSVPVWSREA